MLKKNFDLKINAHFEDVFQIYPSMLEKSTAAFTISTLVNFFSYPCTPSEQKGPKGADCKFHWEITTKKKLIWVPLKFKRGSKKKKSTDRRFWS